MAPLHDGWLNDEEFLRYNRDLRAGDCVITHAPMTRTQQTWLIMGTIILAVVVLVTAYIVVENKKDFDKRYPGCWQLVGDNSACKAAIARQRLMGGY